MARSKPKRTARPSGTTALHREPREDLEGAFDWDPARPLAEQWPWNGAGSPQREHEDLLGDVEVQMAAGAEPEPGVEVAVETGPDAEPDDETPDISAGYDGQGACEGCGKPIRDGDDVHAWEDHIVSHVDCPIDLDDVPAQPDAYVPGGSVCIADDVTECECAKCAAADEQWERDQGWTDSDDAPMGAFGELVDERADCDPAALEDDDATSGVDTADAIEAQEQPGAFDELHDEPGESDPAAGEP